MQKTSLLFSKECFLVDMGNEWYDGFPEEFESESELVRFLTKPQPELVREIRNVSSPLLILGAGGKMGPSLALLARRAAEEAGHPLEIVAVSRFSDPDLRQELEENGIRTIGADLLQSSEVKKLPEAGDVVYLVGMKFGTSQHPAMTWALNTLVPAQVAQRYADARIVALSTGNVYPLVQANEAGSVETDELIPLGEYPNAAVARERLFDFFAARQGTRLAIARLNYAVEMRYGVLVDLAQMVHSGQAIDLTMGYFNCIWQGDANHYILRLLNAVEDPPVRFNLTDPAIRSVRETAAKLGRHLGMEPVLQGEEAPSALLNNPARLCQRFGPPPSDFDSIVRCTARWILRGGRTYNRPTSFQVRDGRF